MAFSKKITDLISKPGFRSFSDSVLVDLNYVDIEPDPFPTPQEAEVWFEIGGKRQSAFIPLAWVNRERRTAKAALIGESGGEVLVSFPPTNYGQTRFYAPMEDLERIADSASIA